MQLDQSRVDIFTLVSRIKSGDLDLQPDFQRGLVWPESKKKRLVDTILREWYIPAIHLVVNDELDREEVLDGQQRLQSIMEFMDDCFTIDGNIAPFDTAVAKLHGLKFSQLPQKVRSRFKRFAIETVRLRDYRSDEPGELFFRLNQITALTSSEQRNALIGRPRNQVKELVEALEGEVGSELLGFSNARLNYDDTLSRLAVALENGSLAQKATAHTLERRYRSGRDFSSEVMATVRASVNRLARALNFCDGAARLNRASLFSWLYFFADHTTEYERTRHELDWYFAAFELARDGVRLSMRHKIPDAARTYSTVLLRNPACQEALQIFTDRASSRVNDVSSILLRDFALNFGLLIAFEDIVALGPKPEYVSVLTHLGQVLEGSRLDPASRLERESQVAKEWEHFRASRPYSA
jgi:hypothetical protein